MELKIFLYADKEYRYNSVMDSYLQFTFNIYQTVLNNKVMKVVKYLFSQ